MKVKSVLFIFFILNSLWVSSQAIQREALYSSGGFGSAGGISVQSNVGEIMASTFVNAQNYLSQGFVQPFQSLITVVNNKNEVNAKAFPNPVRDKLSIELQGIVDQKMLVIEVYDIVGRKQNFTIINEVYDSEKSVFNLELNSLSAGIYFIKITDLQKGFAMTFSINKL